MPAVQVRDFSQEIYDLIKQEAKANGRSIMQQTKHIVLEHFAGRGQASDVVSVHVPPGYSGIEGEELVVLDGADKVARIGGSDIAFQGDGPGVASLPSGIVNPFSPASANAAQQRARRRDALFARIAQRSYPDAALALDSAQLVREMRDGR